MARPDPASWSRPVSLATTKLERRRRRGQAIPPTDSSPAPAIPPPACPNCGAPLAGAFCASCGQRASALLLPFRELVGEWLSAVLALDSRLLRTLAPLLLKPGWLTLEYLAGRRARYVHPAKLFLAVSVALFLALAASGYSVVRQARPGEARRSIIAYSLDDIATPSEPGETATKQAKETEISTPNWFQESGARYANDPYRFNKIFVDHLAHVVILLVPVFALLLKLFYRRQLLLQHLVFSLHLHTFAFCLILAAIAVNTALATPGGPASNIAVSGTWVWAFVALRRVYREGRVRTFFKLCGLLLSYLLPFLTVMMLAVVLSFLLA